MDPLETPAVISMKEYKNKQLLSSLLDKFTDSFGTQPAFVACVPGRVNLIGEHVDYCGYSVLPMALEQHILIAAKSSGDSTLSLVNMDPKYPNHKCNIEDLKVDISNGVHWYSYVICGIRGIIEISSGKKIRGMLLAVAGNIPPNSGLSSSSALVCAAALATSHANELVFTKQELASLCAKSERYIGTEGGGMDQAIGFLANFGCAKHISFKPLRATDVKIPSGLAIVVAHSCAELNKAAGDQFNHRVAECRLASMVLAFKSGLSNWKEMSVFADLQTSLNQSLSGMISLTSEILSQDSYSKDEICKTLEIDQQDLDRYIPENIRHANIFKLQQRAIHVFKEALRVEQFQEICKSGGNGMELGHLMNLSHDSLRDLYECSHPLLDLLVSTNRKCGALGARLTGAGWGGCMVAITTEEHVELLMSSLKENFYSTQQCKGKEDNLLVFHSQPGNGAVILK